MARIFSIQFTYNLALHNVMVSVKTTPFYREYSLLGLDESLYNLLPGNKFIATSASNYLFPNAGAGHSKELMNNILAAVAAHLQTTEQ